jgi:hypothetical protein
MRLQASEKRGCTRCRPSVIHRWLFAGLKGSADANCVRSIHYQSLRTDINSAALDLCSICPNALAKKDDVNPSTMHAHCHSRKGHRAQHAHFRSQGCVARRHRKFSVACTWVQWRRCTNGCSGIRSCRCARGLGATVTLPNGCCTRAIALDGSDARNAESGPQQFVS